MKVTKTQLKKIIKEELARMEGHESSTDLETMVHDLGTPDLILQVLQAVSQEVPEFEAAFKQHLLQVLQAVSQKVPGFEAAFKQHYDYFMSE
jgi:DNA replicative helicase MCM subunit Mcm2 (Cdc46/Mcm family)